MCLGQEPTHCHTWHVHFHLSRWRCGQGESNICINQAGNWHSDARARAVRARRIFGDFRQKCQNAQKPRDGKNPQNGQKHLSFWQRPKFLKSGQNFRASKILSPTMPSFPRAIRFVQSIRAVRSVWSDLRSARPDPCVPICEVRSDASPTRSMLRSVRPDLRGPIHASRSERPDPSDPSDPVRSIRSVRSDPRSERLNPCDPVRATRSAQCICAPPSRISCTPWSRRDRPAGA